MSELSIINQKAGPLGEKNFGNPGVGNEIKSVGNSNSMGLDDDITGQSLSGKLQSPLSRSALTASRLEYPIDVSGNPAYSATIKFQVLEYTTASPGQSQKNHITTTTDNIQSQETTKAKVEDDPNASNIGGGGSDIGAPSTVSFSDDASNSGYAGISSNSIGDFSDFNGVNEFKTKQDAKAEFNNIKKTTANSSNFKLGFFPKTTAPIVTMYFPPSQAFLDGVQYGDATLGAIGGAALSGIEAGGTGISAAGNQIKSEAKSFIDTFFKGGLSLSAAAESEAARLAASRAIERNPLTNLNSGLGAAAGLANRIIVNPNVRKLFNGVTVREFTFQFKMIPTSPEEGEIIQKIIKLFRKEMYPRAFKVPVGGESNVSLGYNFPNAFKIKFNFKDSENRNIPKLLPCYLRNVSHTINPTGGGFKNDGKANETDLTLAFVEHRAIEQQDIEKGY
jgi:hypothetical protein